MKRLTAIVVLVCFGAAMISGCATTKDGQRTQAEGTAVGAGVGAAVGGILGAVIGGRKGAALGAAIGAGLGGAAGYAYGTHVAQEKQKYANEEDWLNACIVSAEKVNQETSAYCTVLDTEVKDLEAKTADLIAKYDQKNIEKSSLEFEQKAVIAKQAEADEKLKKARLELQNQETVLADARANNKAAYSTRLESEIETLKKNIADLEAHTSSLASMSQRMSV